ncbi:hypothetical protein [Sphingomonas faeni]|uniref:hypothetical protein n=1 Tax=Sphingomonas faeni TaxID=185950 RepID=UPI00334D02CF
MIWQHPSALSIRDRDIALMPIAVEPEFATPLRTACFAIVGITFFAALFGSLLS